MSNNKYGTGFQQFTAFEYLLIDISNHFGLDKETYEVRIQWAKDNINNYLNLVSQADTPELFHKTAMTIDRVRRGQETGHIVYWDGVCSGVQIMSALTGCEAGAYNTGCIDPTKRMDAYSNTTEVMNKILTKSGFDNITVPRNHIKQCLMTAGYGSKAVPKKVFGEGAMLDMFYEAAHIIAPGAFVLMDELLGSWRPFALEHVLELPDGFIAKMKVMETMETRVEVDELNHSTFTMEYKENKGTEKGRANVANTIHACDAYLLREIIRSCKYDKGIVSSACGILEARLLAHSMGKQTAPASGDMVRRIRLWNQHKQASLVILNDISWNNYMEIPIELARILKHKVDFMLSYEPFDVSTVHDAIGSLPSMCNEVRYHYKELLAEFAESTILEALMNQLFGITNGKYTKLSDDLGEKIRGSNYCLS